MRAYVVVVLIASGLTGTFWDAAWDLPGWWTALAWGALAAGVAVDLAAHHRRRRVHGEELRGQRRQVYGHIYDHASERVQERAR